MTSAQPAPETRPLGSLILAGAQLCTTVGLVLLSALTSDAASSWAWRSTLAATLGLWWWLRRRTRAVAERRADTLDERDLSARNHAGWWGYATAVTAGTGVALLMTILSHLHGIDPAEALERIGTTLIALMLLAAMVPTAVLAVNTTTD